MSTTVLRIAPDRDEYVVWESIIDEPIFAGTREDVARYLRDQIDDDVALQIKQGYAEVEDRLDRAEKNGTSACWDDGKDWDGDRKSIFQQQGWVKVEDMAKMSLMLDRGEDVSELVAPLKDEDDG